MKQIIYIVFDVYDSVFSYDGNIETMDDAYILEEDAKDRVEELNRGKLKSDPKAFYTAVNLK